MATFFFWGIITICIISFTGMIIDLCKQAKKEADYEIRRGN